MPNVYAWGPDAHNDFAVKIAKAFGLGTTYQDYLKQGCNWPDTAEAGQNPLDHAYNPGTGIGGAAGWAATYADWARSYYAIGSYNNAFNYLGRASHYTADVSNCFHTSPLGVIYHDTYEQGIMDDWSSYKNSLNEFVMPGFTPFQCVQNIAGESSIDEIGIGYAISTNPSNWKNDPAVISMTEDNIDIGSRYTNSLMYRMLGYY